MVPAPWRLLLLPLLVLPFQMLLVGRRRRREGVAETVRLDPDPYARVRAACNSSVPQIIDIEYEQPRVITRNDGLHC